MSDWGIELELGFILVVMIIGTSSFAVFEIETPPWRKMLKWTLVSLITMGLYPLIGHWAILPALSMALVGLTFHFVWCKKNGIDPINATPRRKYYELRGWKWLE